MASSNPGKGLVFNGNLTTSNQVTFNIEPTEYVSGSFHLQTDGTQSVTVLLQASNVPGAMSGLGPAYVRNETATSQDYATLSTTTIGTGTGTQNTMISLPTDPYRSVRLMMTTGAGTSACKVWYRSTGVAS